MFNLIAYLMMATGLMICTVLAYGQTPVATIPALYSLGLLGLFGLSLGVVGLVSHRK